MPIQVVWLKRDFRTQDHAPLSRACERGQTLALYILEPAWLSSPEFDPCHLVFVAQSLDSLHDRLRARGIPLLIRVGEAVAILSELRRELDRASLPWSGGSLHSHEETGLDWSYARDRAVKLWARDQGIEWREYAQFGVVRGLRDRDRWLTARNRLLLRPLHPEPAQAWPELGSLDLGRLPSLAELGLPPSQKTQAQRGGWEAASTTLTSFLEDRSRRYFGSISQPVTAFDGCSRLSAYLSWGNLSMSEVLQAVTQKREQLGELHDFSGGEWSRETRVWDRSLAQFENRLAWHCHFIQKLESEPELEFENANRAFNGLRESEFDRARFEAWCQGETGFPIVDAAMRALRVHGWINFRMRAMLMSFASYQLWLHWRETAQFLARQFVDFEPGIHFSQAQMQSGVTGINAIRIYSPKKQAIEKDPDGAFIRRYCPELSRLPTADLAEPHRMPPLLASAHGFVLGRDYPAPIVDPEESYRVAKERIFQWSRRPQTRRAAQEVFIRHGSRRSRHFSQRDSTTPMSAPNLDRSQAD